MTPLLFLAPFRTMAQMAAKIAKEMGVPLIVEITTDQMAQADVKKHLGVEVVISRGGIAEEIKAIDGITVVEVTMSIDQLLCNLGKLTQNGAKRIGIVSRANIFDGIRGEFRISESEIILRPCADNDEIYRTVIQLHEKNVEAIIGCRTAYETAKKCGIAAEYLDSDAVSIRRSIEEALRIIKAREQAKLQRAQLAAIIDNIEEGIIAITEEKTISFSNSIARQVCTPNGEKLNFKDVEAFLQYRNEKKILTIHGNGVLARIIPLEFNNKNVGDVITFQEVSSIQDSERKIRFSSYHKGLYAKYTFSDIIYKSLSMNRTIQKAKTYARYDSNLLIYGETGTGKEVLTQSIHNQSKRKNGPFVSVNIASIAPSVLESELFGYVEGAFTGARKGGKQGLFELAHGGTIFLDEIGELSSDIQSRLLRVLQEKEIMRIGDDKIIPVDVRIMSATNRNLFELVNEGKFRADLYYRISVLGLQLSPLRERVEDIPLLFENFVRIFAEKENKEIRIHPNAMEMIMAYSWPGNIRELRNIAEVVVYTTEGDLIESCHIQDIFHEKQTKTNSENALTIQNSGTLKEMESEIVRQLLAKYNAEEVCQRLGISRVTLWRKTSANF